MQCTSTTRRSRPARGHRVCSPVSPPTPQPLQSKPLNICRLCVKVLLPRGQVSPHVTFEVRGEAVRCTDAVRLCPIGGRAVYCHIGTTRHKENR